MKTCNSIKCNDYFIFDIFEDYQNCSGIYKIINNKTNYIYIGRTKCFKNRYLEHFHNFINNKNNSKIKYLRSCFDTIVFKMQIVEITSDLVEKEMYYIREYNSVTNGLNVLKEDKDIIKLFGNQLNSSNDLIFKDEDLNVIVNKKENLNILSKQRKYNMNFKNPDFQKFLAKNGFSTNGKAFYLKKDGKLHLIHKKYFIEELIKCNIIDKDFCKS